MVQLAGLTIASENAVGRSAVRNLGARLHPRLEAPKLVATSSIHETSARYRTIDGGCFCFCTVQDEARWIHGRFSDSFLG